MTELSTSPSGSSPEGTSSKVSNEELPACKATKKLASTAWEPHFRQLIHELLVGLFIVLPITILGIILPLALTVGIGCGELALVIAIWNTAIIFYTIVFIWQRSRYRIGCRCCVKSVHDLHCCIHCDDAEERID